MSNQQGGHGQRDPYEGAPQYGSAGGSSGQPINPLMYNFGNRSGGPTQAADKLTMRKQGNPTMLASHSQPNYYGGDYQQGGQQTGSYYQGNYDSRYSRQSAHSGYQTSPGQQVHDHQESPQPVSTHLAQPAQPLPQSAQPIIVAAPAAVAKVPVESETEYPRPHRGDSLLGVFFTDPAKFEGIRY
jgi:hypothetical protein